MQTLFSFREFFTNKTIFTNYRNKNLKDTVQAFIIFVKKNCQKLKYLTKEMETEKEFELATKYVQEKLAKIKQPTQEQQLQFYGLYKVATIGKCTISKPNFWNMVEKAKWFSFY